MIMLPAHLPVETNHMLVFVFIIVHPLLLVMSLYGFGGLETAHLGWYVLDILVTETDKDFNER